MADTITAFAPEPTGRDTFASPVYIIRAGQLAFYTNAPDAQAPSDAAAIALQYVTDMARAGDYKIDPCLRHWLGYGGSA